MKYFRNALRRLLTPRVWRSGGYWTWRLLLVSAAFVCAATAAWAAIEWKNVEAGSAIEAALYRWMPMPVSKVLGLRPPREAVGQLSDLIRHQPAAELYSLRALNEEAALDFAAAESDWKKYTETASDHLEANLALADFYHRRLRAMDEITALSVVARAPAAGGEQLLRSEQQRSWTAFDRIFRVIQENALPAEVSEQNYRAWITRYPAEKQVYARYFQYLLEHKVFAEAERLVAQYQAAFPNDDVFPVKARALLAYKKGSVGQGLAIYDAQFQPLWPAELVQSYFELLTETRSLRQYADGARSALERNPEDLNAAARLYFYYQHQGRTDAAQQVINSFREHKDQRAGKWTSQELYTLARLSEGLRSYPEGARYYYALYNSNDRRDAQELALAGLANLLLEAPEQGVRLGSGNLSMYRDIGTIDRGPGFLNGILSMVLNSTSPAYKYSEEEQRAVPYFHRAQAAELIRLIDARFASAPARPALHARLLEAYAAYGESEAVIRDGRQFLATFPNSAQRGQVALVMADAYARTGREQDEFALYDALLGELAKRADGVPLGSQATVAPESAPEPVPSDANQFPAGEGEGEGEGEEAAPPPQPKPEARRAFSISSGTNAAGGVRSPEYSRVLERYLSRLVATDKVPQALAVLRKEIDRNPNDPGLYERLAQFLEQNRLGQQQEEVYRRALQQFNDRSWYHKLARFYLREKRDAEFSRLSEQVIKIFSGTELENYFADVVNGGDYYRRLNEYAHARFPHDLRFVRNLLVLNPPDPQLTQQLLREHWWEAEDLRNRFFEMLSRAGKLDQELAALKQTESAAQQGRWPELASGNPVAARFIGEAQFWRSHFEQGAPVMGALAQQFPADSDIGERATSAFRSLAAFDPRNTQTAAGIAEDLEKADPGNRELLARVGDVFADQGQFERASPYWQRMAQVRPGEAQAYLDAAAVYWDYFDFDAALRLLNEGRSKLGNANLYAYEEGAIYEGKRDYAAAVAEYVKGAMQEQEGSRARSRLLDLARRPNLRETVDKATSALAEGTTPELDAMKLRLQVLEAQNRPKEAEQLLASVAQRTSSLELLEWLEATARQKSLVGVQQQVLERQAAVTTDPVRRLELRYALVRFYEGKKDVEAAARNVAALYRENPKILGVVRATVDFYWRNRQTQPALDVLLQAANAAYPDLAVQFRFEAARKSTEAKQFEQARKLLTQLLQASPYNDEYLAAMADTFARAGDDQGLKAFYLREIDTFRKASLPQETRDRQIAGLRRGLIPALTRLKDYTGAVDQYIEIINRYPEDDALVSEAALYAQRYERQQQLLAMYRNTVRQSPRDYRWPMVLARIEAQLEDFPAAIDAYETAIKVRPDRVDLRSARADLLERLMRFDDAAADYQRLFDLNYHDTRWMEKLALVRARQGRVTDAVTALRLALIENRPEKAENYFEVARRLDSWDMLEASREYASKGVDAAGRDLLAVNEHHAGAALYVRILTRLRQQDAAYQRLQTAIVDADSLAASAGMAVEQVQKQGIAAVTDRQWRERALAGRREAARAGMKVAMTSMGSAVNQYFTPEEKVAFSAALSSKAAQAGDADLAQFFVPGAAAAELADLEARWTERLLLSSYAQQSGAVYAYKNRLTQLQTRRMRFQELGAALQTYASTLRPDQRWAVLRDAARAFRAGAASEQEMSVLASMPGSLNAPEQQRLFELLLQRRPQQLVQIAGGGKGGVASAAAEYAIVHGGTPLALGAVAAHGRGLPPVWTTAYSALTGLYHADRSPATNSAFLTALGDATIGERLGKPVDRNLQLAGSTWFYYGSRYGEYLGITATGDPEDFLPALLEQSPGTAAGYVTTAEYYADAGKVDRAIQDYGHTLELAPGRADIHDRLALLYWREGKRADAVAEWKQALEILNAQVNQRVVPASFWPTASYTLNHLGNRNLLMELRPQADAVLRNYVRKNGTYRVSELLRNLYVATRDPQSGTAWLLELAAVAPDATSFLTQLAEAKWIAAPARDAIFQRILSSLQDRVGASEGLSKQYAETDLRIWQVRYARYLVDQKQFDRAAVVLLPLPEQPSPIELELWLRIALARGEFDTVLARYRSAPEQAPAAITLRDAARSLQLLGQRAAARKLLEFVLAQEIAAHQLTSANMLGLAEIRLEDGDTGGALELLRRLTLVVGQPFENLGAAASLLARTGHHAEAAEFLAQRVKAVPWDVGARVQLAQEQAAAAADMPAARALASSVAASHVAPYSERAKAAVVLAGSRPSSLGSGELDALASGTTNVETVDRPYFCSARLRAAENSSGPEARVQLLRAAISDCPERGDARVPLMLALAGLGRDQLAISAVEPLLHPGYSSSESAVSAPESGTDVTAEEAPEAQDTEANIYEVSGVPQAERAIVAITLGRAYSALEEYDAALRFFRIAAALEKDAAKKAEINKRIRAVQATMRRNANNQQRAPMIHNELDQPRVVRPRLVAKAAPVAPAGKKGGAQ